MSAIGRNDDHAFIRESANYGRNDDQGHIGKVIKADSRNYLGVNPYEFWVEWSDVESEESKKTKQLDVSIGVGVEHWGIKANVEGTYGKGEVSTQKVSFENSTSIHIYFDAIKQSYSYWLDFGHFSILLHLVVQSKKFRYLVGRFYDLTRKWAVFAHLLDNNAILAKVEIGWSRISTGHRPPYIWWLTTQRDR